jgi:hypothetical protein
LAIAAAAALATAAVGCGGSSGDTSASGESAEADEGASSFIVKGKKNPIAAFGKEATSAEREAASKVLEENLEAREKGKWSVQCATLSKSVVAGIEERGSFIGIKGGCGKDLEAEAEPVPESVRANTMTGPVDVLRTKGARAYALYHGTGGKNYAMEMKKEGGEWKVASLNTVNLPTS